MRISCVTQVDDLKLNFKLLCEFSNVHDICLLIFYCGDFENEAILGNHYSDHVLDA